MDPMTIALVLLWIAVLCLTLVTLALARQIGILFERVAPMGALMTDPHLKIGEAAPTFALPDLNAGPTVTIGGAGARGLLLFFLSPTCPVCKKLLPVLKSVQRSESRWMDVVLASDGDEPDQLRFIETHRLKGFPYVLSTDLGRAFRVSRLPFGVVLDSEGIIRAKGLVNSREQLESLFNAKEMDVVSIQNYLDKAKEA